MIWAASTEVFLTPGPAHQSLEAFERAMEQNDPAIAPSMLYAYAALMENVPFANGAPNLTVDVPALQHLAEERKLPIGGKNRSEEHTSELQSRLHLVCRLLLAKKKHTRS